MTNLLDTSPWTSGSVSVVILGAGFSAAATDGATPLMNNFFNRLDQNQEPNLFECVSCLANDYRTANVEKVLVVLEQMATSPDNVLNDWAACKWKTSLPLLRRELSFYFYCLWSTTLMELPFG